MGSGIFYKPKKIPSKHVHKPYKIYFIRFSESRIGVSLVDLKLSISVIWCIFCPTISVAKYIRLAASFNLRRRLIRGGRIDPYSVSKKCKSKLIVIG